MNSVERIRLRTGLTKWQFSDLIRHHQSDLFDLDDREIPSTIQERAEQINAGYALWQNQLNANICEFQENTRFTPRQAANLLGTSEFHLASLRQRGELKAIADDGTYTYSPAALRDLIAYNSEALAINPHKVRGPLAGAFDSWYRGFVRS